jgi:hypothetical protein
VSRADAILLACAAAGGAVVTWRERTVVGGGRILRPLLAGILVAGYLELSGRSHELPLAALFASLTLFFLAMRRLAQKLFHR